MSELKKWTENISLRECASGFIKAEKELVELQSKAALCDVLEKRYSEDYDKAQERLELDLRMGELSRKAAAFDLLMSRVQRVRVIDRYCYEIIWYGEPIVRGCELEAVERDLMKKEESCCT